MIGDLVYLRTLRGGPAPEKWPADAPVGIATDKVVLGRRPLSAAEWELPLAELQQRYSMPPERLR